MGTVLRFPKATRTTRAGSVTIERGSATVVILPVIRIERYQAEPFESERIRARRRRRRRASRS
jgi:hypothetical protein